MSHSGRHEPEVVGSPVLPGTASGWELHARLPPGVFHPGETSRLLHTRLLDGTLPVTGLRYAAMGCGLGVETVAAGAWGARVVYALDVHPESVRTAARHYAKIVGPDGPPLVPLVADVCLVARELLAPGGVVYLILSNTAPLRDVVALALELGFGAEVVHVEDWEGDNVQTYLFEMRRD